jgi:hypothetical protein
MKFHPPATKAKSTILPTGQAIKKQIIPADSGSAAGFTRFFGRFS